MDSWNVLGSAGCTPSNPGPCRAVNSLHCPMGDFCWDALEKRGKRASFMDDIMQGTVFSCSLPTQQRGAPVILQMMQFLSPCSHLTPSWGSFPCGAPRRPSVSVLNENQARPQK